MQIYQVVLLTLLVMVLLLAIKVPVAMSLGLSGALGLVLLRGTDYANNTLASVPFTATASFTLTIIPMFILMGMFAVRANVAESVFTVANHFVRKAPGGLGVATVMACAGFAAVSGSSIGTAATMAKLSVEQMRAKGYPASFATGIVTVAGTLGVLIPPSTFLVLYAVLASESVARMLLAGVVPGLLSAAAYVIYILIVGQRKVAGVGQPEDLAAAVSVAREELRDTAAQRSPLPRGGTSPTGTPPLPGPRSSARSLPWRGVVYIAVLFTAVLGGMYSGVFTATESAAVGAFAGLIILVIENRREGVRRLFRHFKDSLLDTAETTAMVFFIVIGSAVLSTFLVAAGVTRAIGDWVGALPLPPHLIMALLLLCLIPIGAFLESMSILVITVPILYPIAMEFGFDGIWLGILIVKLIEIGMVTPPVGIITFVVAGSTGVKTETVFKGVLPFVLIDLVTTAVLFVFPAIALFLPSLARQ